MRATQSLAGGGAGTDLPAADKTNWRQDDEVEGLEGTCALISVANVSVTLARLNSQRWQDGGCVYGDRRIAA